MSFKEFVINYFSPIFFILRCFLLWTSFCSYFILPTVLYHFGMGNLSNPIGAITSIYILYKAIKPWRVGMTIGEAKQKYDSFINKNTW